MFRQTASSSPVEGGRESSPQNARAAWNLVTVRGGRLEKHSEPLTIHRDGLHAAVSGAAEARIFLVARGDGRAAVADLQPAGGDAAREVVVVDGLGAEAQDRKEEGE